MSIRDEINKDLRHLNDAGEVVLWNLEDYDVKEVFEASLKRRIFEEDENIADMEARGHDMGWRKRMNAARKDVLLRYFG